MSKLKAEKLGATGSVDLPADIFSEGFRGPLVHEVVRSELAAKRQGTASTKTRGLVRGGGTKPWRQKGTGRARIGSIRAPHWTGGGTVFGPAPRHYTFKVNRKARRRALRAALSLHADGGTIAIVDTGLFDGPSTAKAAKLIKEWGCDRPTLLLVAAGEEACAKSFRNIKDVDVSLVDDVEVARLVKAASLVVTAQALERLSSLAAPRAERKDKKEVKPQAQEVKG